MEIFLLYLLMQADSISSALGFVSVVTSVIFAGAFIGVLVTTGNAYEYGPDSEHRKEGLARAARIAKWRNKIGCVALPLFIACMLFPSTKTLAVMIGGHYALQAVKSDTAQKLLELVNNELDKALNERGRKK